MQFFSDVREAEEQLRKLQETLRRKYTCDRSITVTRLEDLLQDAQVSPQCRGESGGRWEGSGSGRDGGVWAALLLPKGPSGCWGRGHDGRDISTAGWAWGTERPGLGSQW